MFARREIPVVRIGVPTSSREGSARRVTALVDGEPAWFESADVALAPSAEAFATAFLVPALHRGARLAVEAPVCERWAGNVDRLLPIFRRWWRTPLLAPAAATSPASASRASRTALLFSSGLDSFFTLMRSNQAVDVLVTVHGFDVALDDAARMAAVEAATRDVASQRGLTSVVVRTNLREHPLMRSVTWDKTHGGALAAVGHLLHESVGRLLVSSSIFHTVAHEPWGSHPATDPLWSSSRLEVVYVGSETRRSDKLRSMMDEPLLQRHLRVCWEYATPAANCGRCEKCLHAMLILAEAGRLDRFPLFEGGADLAARVDALPRRRHLRRAYDELSESDRLPADVIRAVRALVRRSRRFDSAPARARRSLLKALGASWSRLTGG